MSALTPPAGWLPGLAHPGGEESADRVPPPDPTRAYLASLSPAGREAMVKRLRAVARLLPADGRAVPAWEAIPWHELRFQHIAFIRQRLQERGAAPATVNLTLAALRGIARYARNLGLMTAEEYDRIRDVPPAKGVRLPAGRSATRGGLLALVEACAADTTLAGARDTAILAVLYVGGVRRAELAALSFEDWQDAPPALRVRRGKGDKERLVPLAGGAVDALREWVRRRGDGPGALFLPINKAGKMRGTSMSDQAIYKVLQKRLGQAGVAKLSPHDFRRTFVGDLLDAGGFAQKLGSGPDFGVGGAANTRLPQGEDDSCAPSPCAGG